MNTGWQIRTRYELHMDDYALVAAYRDHEGKQYIARPIELAAFPVGRAVGDSQLTLGGPGATGALTDVRGFLQAALDAAWELGLRPKGFADHKSELTAVRYHLEDMRALAKVPAR